MTEFRKLAVLLVASKFLVTRGKPGGLRRGLLSNATQAINESENISEIPIVTSQDVGLDVLVEQTTTLGQLTAQGEVASLAQVTGSWSYACYTMPWLPGCGSPYYGGYSPQPQPQNYPRDDTVLTLYHATSAEAGASILKTGFRPGHVGYCGGGIYFATSPAETLGKAVGPDSHQGFMLEARVNLGKIKHIRNPSCTSSQLGVYHLDREPLSKYLNDWGCDSVTFNPGDGEEYAVADPSRVLSVKHYAGYQYR